MKPVTEVIDQLQQQVAKSDAFKDVCHMLVLRKRTRSRLNVTRLKQVMDEEGFNYNRRELEEVLRFMGRIGLGQLSISKRGHVKSLGNIQHSLQSIGEAALSNTKALKQKPQVKRYENLVALTAPLHKAEFIEKPVKISNKPTIRAEEPYPVFLTMIMGGKLVNIPGPVNVTPENIGEFIVKFKQLSKKGDLGV